MSALQKLPPRVVHAQGYTEAAFSPDGSRILSVGDDAILRIVSTTAVRDEDDEDEDAITIEQHKAAITCLDVLGNSIVTGSEDQAVCLYSLADAQFKRVLLRCSLTVRDVAIRPGRHGPNKAQWVAVASDELNIRLIDTEDITNVITITGHRRGLKSVAFDPQGEFLVSAGSDGELMVWDLRSDQPKLERALRSLISASDPETYEYSRIVWHPSGKFFAVPGKLGDVAVVEAYTWKHKYFLKEENRSECIALVAWSATGTYLSTVNVKSRFCIWKPEEDRKNPIMSDQSKARITSMSWHPKENDLCLMDALGRMMYWTNAVPTSEREKGELERLFQEEAMQVDREAPPSRGDATKPVEDEELAQYNADLLDELDADENAEDFVVDDDGAGYANPLGKPGQLKRYQEKGRQQILKELDKEYGSRRSRMPFSDFEVQEAFQPGATPMQNSRRYLAFNMVGVIYTIDSHSHHSVNVEFHDRSIRPFHFTDYHNYSMACLGETGACFASEATAGNPSTLFYRPFDTWATKADWTMHFAESESIKAVAITSKGPVAATSSQYLRLFSYSGLQTFIMSLPGPVVTLGAQGEWLLIVYQAGGVYHGEQNLAYKLYNVETKKTVRQDGIPLSPGSTLEWVGVSEAGIPATYDSVGVLRCLLRHNDFAWVPVLDSRIVRGEKQEWYWPIEVMEDKLMCIICKAGDKYPGFPRPLISDVTLQVPFLDMDTPSGVQEEKLFRSSILASHYRGEAETKGEADMKEKELLRRDVEMDKILVQLILTACKGEKVQRALDLCGCLQTIKAIDGAIKIAVLNHLPALAERMNMIKESRLRQQRDAEEKRNRRSSQFYGATPHSGISALLSATKTDAQKDLGFGMRRYEEVASPVPARKREDRRRVPSKDVEQRRTRQLRDEEEDNSRMDEDDRVTHVEDREDDRMTHVEDREDDSRDNEERYESAKPPLAERQEVPVPLVRNPFAFAKPPPAYVNGCRNLPDTMKIITESLNRKELQDKETDENSKKRKNQGTLFGIGRKEVDYAGPVEKRVKRGDNGSEDKRPVSSIAKFFGKMDREDEEESFADHKEEAKGMDVDDAVDEEGNESDIAKENEKDGQEEDEPLRKSNDSHVWKPEFRKGTLPPKLKEGKVGFRGGLGRKDDNDGEGEKEGEGTGRKNLKEFMFKRGVGTER